MPELVPLHWRLLLLLLLLSDLGHVDEQARAVCWHGICKQDGRARQQTAATLIFNNRSVCTWCQHAAIAHTRQPLSCAG
jgi:hypothetical protein